MTRFLSEEFSKSSHNRALFNSGNQEIDSYFATRLSQDIKRDFAKCFVLIERDTRKIAGYYTLSATSIPLDQMPSELARKLPPYPSAPATLLGRLGRDLNFRGEGIGRMLLYDAIRRVMNEQSASYAIRADAIDGKAASFYQRHGFLPLTSDAASSFFLPIKTALQLVKG